MSRPSRRPGRRVFSRVAALGRSFAFLLLVAACTAPGLRAAEPPRKNYDIPAGDAAATLKQFVAQSGEQVVYLVNKVRGVSTHALRGEFDARTALDRMLAGTELYAVQDAQTGALVINRAPAAPPPKDAPAAPAPAPPPAGTTTAAVGRGERGDTIVQLPTFTISSARDDSYIGRQALSTTRTGIELLELAQSVKVINRAFLDDLNPGLIVDTLKYVGGGQAGNINFADDRFTLRGFNSPANIGDFVDGFRGTTDSNTDPAILERLEIIKGPSAIFVANGPVGGVINKITKGPVSYAVRTLKVQAGSFDANRAELDLGGPVTADRRLLYRLVLAGQYSDGWYDHTYSHRLVLAPSVSYVFSETSRLTLKYNFFVYRYSSYNGLPFDERTGRIIDLPRRATFSEDAPLNWRRDIVHRGLLEYTNRPNEHVALRLAGFYSYNDAARIESVNGLSLPPHFVNGTKLNRSTTAQDQVHFRRQVQGDLVATFVTGPLDHRLLLGGEWADAPDIVASFAGTSSPIDPFALVFPGTVTVATATPASKLRTNNRQWKSYALETLSLFHRRLLLSGGVSRIQARTSSTNQLAGTSTAPLALAQNLQQYGAVFQAAPGVSLFYGYNENFAPNFLNGRVLPSQLGRQNELGVKTDLLAGRLQASIAWFDLRQENVPVPAFPQTSPPTFVLVPGETSRGFDGDISFQATRNLDVIFTFAMFDAEAHSQANTTAPLVAAPVNNVAEQTCGLWTRYKFLAGPLKGLAVGLGLSHLSKRAVASNNNAIVYGWLDPFTVADLAVSYDRGAVRYGLNLDNLANTSYDAAVRNQSIVVPGMGPNVKASVTWRF